MNSWAQKRQVPENEPHTKLVENQVPCGTSYVHLPGTQRNKGLKSSHQEHVRLADIQDHLSQHQIAPVW